MASDQDILMHTMNVVISSLSIPIGLSNTIKSIKIIRQERAFIFKLNLGQSLILLVSKLTQTIFILKNQPNCQFLIYFAAITYYLSTMMIEVILITKAYYANLRSKTVVGLGAFIELCRFVIHVVILIHIKSTYGPLGSCFSYGTDTLFTVLIATEGCLIIFLTVAFVGSLWRVSRIQNGGVYSALIKDGLIYFFSICLVIMIIIVLIATGAAPPVNGYFLDFGWAVSSKIMTEQLYESHHRRKSRSQALSQSLSHPTVDFPTAKQYEHSTRALTFNDSTDLDGSESTKKTSTYS
ncbi:hypothetical protein K7432_009692 [Basidiobolus ranarum]|uniref:Uncharacterized protein n=1 Tax=Basidiobolus ranarum TaxID=34480 RepID=A0ABR2WPT8_9FUNG